MVEFKYELRDRYGFGVFNTPSHYDDCNSKFLITHDLDYKRGGLIHARHDESHDSFDCLACAGFQSSNVCDEPQINHIAPLEGEMNAMKEKNSSRIIRVSRWKALRIVVICQFMVFGIGALIAPYMFVSVMSIRPPIKLVNLPRLQNRQKMTKRRYFKPCLKQRRHFTPFVVSCEGLLGKEVDTFLKHLSKKLADKWRRPYSRAVSFC